MLRSKRLVAEQHGRCDEEDVDVYGDVFVFKNEVGSREAASDAGVARWCGSTGRDDVISAGKKLKVDVGSGDREPQLEGGWADECDAHLVGNDEDRDLQAEGCREEEPDAHRDAPETTVRTSHLLGGGGEHRLGGGGKCDADLLHALNAKILSLCLEVAATKEHTKKCTDLAIRIDKIVKCVCGRHARVELFGSSVSGLATTQSDLDLTIKLLGEENMDVSKKKDYLKRLSKVFRFQHGMNSFAVLTARVPVIKLKDGVSGLAADVSIQTDLPVLKSMLFLYYSRIDERFKQLVYVVKTWSKKRNINNAAQGSLNSFGWSLLVLFFLQNTSPPVLPSLHQQTLPLRGVPLRNAQEKGGEEVLHLPTHPQGVVGDVVVHHHTDAALLGWGADNEQTPAQLLHGFFKFYATEFPLATETVCVRAGCPQPSGEKEGEFWLSDPLQPTENSARTVNARSSKKILEEIERAHHVLESCGDLDELLDEA